MSSIDSIDLISLADNIKVWGASLGFQQVGIADIDLSKHKVALQRWLDNGYNGSMQYMQNNLDKRTSPELLVENTCRIISVRMNYLPPDASFATALSDAKIGYISRYALGRDYHKVMRKRLQQLAEKIKRHCSNFSFRAFVDSAPVLEHAIAEKAGIGWTGKHSLTLNEEAGSWFFLGELFINLPLPIDQPVTAQCGNCVACISICPTGAIEEPYVINAKKCISYLTIENKGSIPVEYRAAIGNRIYGCDDCQLICPWNRYADITDETDFYARDQIFNRPLLQLFSWSEAQFLKNTEGSPIRRIGYVQWRRNIAIAIGNDEPREENFTVLKQALLLEKNDMVAEHIKWSLQQLVQRQDHKQRLTARLIRSVEKGLPRDA